MKKVRNLEATWLRRQSDLDDGNVFASETKLGIWDKKENTWYESKHRKEVVEERKKNIKLIELVKRFPPEIHDVLILRDEGLHNLPSSMEPFCKLRELDVCNNSLKVRLIGVLVNLGKYLCFRSFLEDYVT